MLSVSGSLIDAIEWGKLAGYIATGFMGGECSLFNIKKKSILTYSLYH